LERKDEEKFSTLHVELHVGSTVDVLHKLWSVLGRGRLCSRHSENSS
jgi:hypothetical protein